MDDVSQYDYELPKELVAQSPLVVRSDARLMLVDRERNSLSHNHVRDLPELLRSGDCLVLNDTRVVPARLVGVRTRTGGRWEGLFLEAGQTGHWRILCKTRGKLASGETITLINAAGTEDVELELGTKEPGGVWVVRPRSDERTFSLLDRVGRVPLPPYIRKGQMVESDRKNYQTVYARSPGAVAAPTAGLHFTASLLSEIESRGIGVVRVTLHVGMGTFRPIEVDSLNEHEMHSEWGSLDATTVDRLLDCRQGGGRIVAVGTTSVRLLETAAAEGELRPFCGHTNLFIRQPYQFKAVDAMMTNFHLPRTTLLVLVRTFGGDDLIMRAYEEAVREEYRFYSYGDAMLIV
ncbi:MAG: tRNA preQ1(34) S-adenosylmethionine ribosyltransferase-isomerase QueA [Planctomycetaceae bacterium]|nr:tRNA preQ1(34) S-adenosylmethionine ribosyltransferase-isomerase QueA [Planctomycetaceae bacterium]